MFPFVDEALLLASVQSELLLLGVQSSTLRLLSSASRPVFSLDYHWAQQRVYWLSPDYQSIRWADMTNTNKKGTLIKGTPVSVPLSLNKVFISGAKLIMMTSNVLIHGMKTPTSTICGCRDELQYSHFYSTGVKSDFIAVDWVGRNLYWVDGLVGQILAVKLSDVTVKSQDFTVVLGEDLEQPSSLVLLPHKG